MVPGSDQPTWGRVVRRPTAAALAKSVTIATSTLDDEWKERVHRGCHTRLDYTTALPFSLTVLLSGTDPCVAHVLVFSPHHASDGFSGLRVLHDFFTALTDPDTDLGGPLPVQRPLLHRSFPRRLRSRYC